MIRRPQPPTASGADLMPEGVRHFSEPRTALPVAAPPTDSLAPLLSVADLARVLNGSRRTIERLRAAGKLPRPDLHIGTMPRWKAETIRCWIEGGGK
jgi:predicted DNA-binding transcriptional regulator AlpA